MKRIKKQRLRAKILREKVKALRRYASGLTADDGYDLRHIRKLSDMPRAKRAKVERLFKIVERLTSRPNKVFRSKDPAKLLRAQQAAQHEEFPKELKVAFFPAIPSEKMKIRFTAHAVEVTQKGIKRRVIDIDPMTLINYPREIIAAVTDANPARVYAVQAGEFEIPRGHNALSLADEIVKLQNKYDGRGEKNSKTDKNHHWSKWLKGIIAYDYPSKIDWQKYNAAKERAKEKLRDLRIKKRKQRNRMK